MKKLIKLCIFEISLESLKSVSRRSFKNLKNTFVKKDVVCKFVEFVLKNDSIMFWFVPTYILTTQWIHSFRTAIEQIEIDFMFIYQNNNEPFFNWSIAWFTVYFTLQMLFASCTAIYRKYVKSMRFQARLSVKSTTKSRKQCGAHCLSLAQSVSHQYLDRCAPQ